MNEVSIIINGVRYDAVEATKNELNNGVIACHMCDLYEHCKQYDNFDMCAELLGSFKYFEKVSNDKKTWLKLERDGGFLKGDATDLDKYLPFLVLEDMSKYGLQDEVHIVDEDNFGEWAGSIERNPRYTHIMPNVEVIEREFNELEDE